MQVFILVAERGYASIKEVYLGEYRNGSLHCLSGETVNRGFTRPLF